MRYIAQKRLKVGDRTVMPGEDVPEAARWPNLSAYIDGGYLVRVMTSETDTAWAADIEARVSVLEALVAGTGDQDGGAEATADSDADEATEAEVPADSDAPEAPPADDDADATDEPIDLDALRGISREELDERAVALGIEDAPKLGSKGAVATAINEAIAQRESTP